MSVFDQDSLNLHEKNKGKLEISSKFNLENKNDLSVAYTPGIAAVSLECAKNPENMYKYTPKGNSVAVISDGSAVLGLGNIGPEGAYPVMEGKCVLFKKFGNVDAYPIILNTQNTEEIIDIISKIIVGFGGINLEDISAPRCFEIEARLKKQLNIPVFHDDQHGTAIVVLAGLINAIKVSNKTLNAKIIINGAGAAGIAIAELLLNYGFNNLILADSIGAIYQGRAEGMNHAKESIAMRTNQAKQSGQLQEIIKNADVFIGVSVANVLNEKMVKSMAEKSIIFAMANPDPEIKEELAIKYGAYIVATGRSDSKNQLNNVLVFPGIFRGILDSNARQFTNEMFVASAKALAGLVENPSAEKIIPSPFEANVANVIAKAIIELGN